MDSIAKSLKIYHDNSTAMFMTKNKKSESLRKHIDIKNLVIKKYIKEIKVVHEHLSTKLTIVNHLTKGLCS